MIDPEIYAAAAVPKRDYPNLRALTDGMLRAAADLSYISGTTSDGKVIRYGLWRWSPDGLPELPKLPSGATARQRRDHRFAEGLRSEMPDLLLKSLLNLRETIAHGVEAEIALRADGYSGKAIAGERVKIGKKMCVHIGDAIERAADASRRLAKARQTLASEGLATKDSDRFLAELGVDDRAEELPDETTRAVTSAVYDTAILAALRPLEQIEKTLLFANSGARLPRQLDDPRVLAAVFRAPRVLVPLSDDELRRVAHLAFRANWPKVAAVALVIEEMLDQVRQVAGEALRLAGNYLDPTNEWDAFRAVPGGRWALEPLVDVDPKARLVFEDLGFS